MAYGAGFFYLFEKQCNCVVINIKILYNALMLAFFNKKNDKMPGLSARIMPIALGIAAFCFFYILIFMGKGFLFASLADIALFISLFLVLTAVFCEIKKLKIDTAKIDKLIKKIAGVFPFAGHSPPESPPEISDNVCPETQASDGLMEIKKDTAASQDKRESNLFLRILEAAYIALFIGLAFWRIYGMFAILPVSFSGLNYNLADAVLFLIFPCIMLIYLKMRKDNGSFPGDKTSYDLLTLFSYLSICYAAVIAASSALNINILPVLKWVYCIVFVYIILSIAFDIFISIFKKNILGDFNYTLIPRLFDAKDQKDSFFDSQELRQTFSLKSLYTIKYALKIFPAVIFSLGFVLFLATTMFVVQPHQQALVYRLGKLNSFSAVSEGLHFKLPWPFDIAEIHDVHRVNSMQIGYASSHTVNYLWTRAHDGGENLMLTGDGNEMVAVNIKINYKISDLYKYVTTSSNPEEILRAAAYEELMYRTVNITLDEFLSVDRISLSSSLLEELSRFCESKDLGLSVLQVIIESIHPPVDIAAIYQRVVSAFILKNEIIIAAETEAQENIIRAQQESRTIVNNAIANKHARVSEAQKEMAVYSAAMEAYARNPASLELTKYLDTYEKIIGGSKVYVFSPRMEAAISRAVIGNANVIGVNYE